MQKPILEQLAQIQFQYCTKADDHHMLSKICIDGSCKKKNQMFEPLCEGCEIEETHKIQRNQHKTQDLKLFLIQLCQMCHKTKDEEIQESRNEKLKEEIIKMMENYKKCHELMNRVISNLETLVDNFDHIIYSNKDYINDQLQNFCEQQKVQLSLIQDQVFINDDGEVSIKKINHMKIRDQEKSIRDNLAEYQKFFDNFNKITDTHANIFLNVRGFEERESLQKNERLREMNIIMKENWVKKSYKNGEYYGEVQFEKMHYGDIKHCKRHGFGIFVYNDGDRYQGQYEDGERTGQGIYYYSNGNRYEGEFFNSKFQGKGKFYYKNGTIYEGDFQDGKSVKLKQIK